MPPVGETLREARLRQQIDIADVEQATKIRSKYLRALEAEEFDRLPGATYVRTFIRSYADFLGLDAQLLVEEYRLRHDPSDDTEAVPLAPAPSARPRRREPRRRPGGGSSGGPSRATMIAGAAAVILVALALLGLLVGDPQGDDGREPANAPRAPDRERGADGGGPGGGDGRPAPETVELEIRPLDETYVCAENGDGRELLNATLTDPETIRGKRLLLNLGHTLGVELEANGEPVQVEESPNPVGLELTPGGQEEIPEGSRPCQ